MADLRVEIHVNQLGQLLRDPAGGIAQGTLRKGIQVATEAKRRCPVDTGRLRSSIGVQQTRNGGVRVGSNVAYARYVHDGTRWMRGRPFLTDAVRAVFR